MAAQSIKSLQQLIENLSKSMPAAADVDLGNALNDVLVGVNALISDVASLRTQYEALLAHLDTANVAGIGSANAATYSPAAATATAVAALNERA